MLRLMASALLAADEQGLSNPARLARLSRSEPARDSFAALKAGRVQGTLLQSQDKARQPKENIMPKKTKPIPDDMPSARGAARGMAGGHAEGHAADAGEAVMTRPAALAASRIFVNLPVQDLKKSIEFFGRLGFAFNPQFTDDTATCMIIGETMFAMLLTREKFSRFTPYPLVDAQRNTEVLVALQLDSRAQVDAILQKALAAGGRDFRPVEDHGWMYGRAFQDLDGHIWEIFWMDPAAMPQQ
jgi:uncharacterized protein